MGNPALKLLPVHTFEQAVMYLRDNHWIDYDVVVENHEGALMKRDTWLAAVKDHNFIDYDGMGSQVNEKGEILENPGYWIHPSTANTILPETAYILWYNR